jgi:hypothetical protein
MGSRWRGRGGASNGGRPNQTNERLQQVGARESSHDVQSQLKSAVAAVMPSDESTPVVGICPTMCSFDEAIEREKHMEVGAIGVMPWHLHFCLSMCTAVFAKTCCSRTSECTASLLACRLACLRQQMKLGISDLHNARSHCSEQSRSIDALQLAL